MEDGVNHRHKRGWEIRESSNSSEYKVARYYCQPTDSIVDYSHKFTGPNFKVITKSSIGSPQSHVGNLKECFADISKPTPEEIALFELEFGIPYMDSDELELFLRQEEDDYVQ